MTGFANVSCFRDRHGSVRYRWRKKGMKTVYLPGKPGDREFAEAHKAANEGAAAVVVGQGRTKPGTINALAVAIYGSADWAGLSDQTKVTYKGIIERLRRGYGNETIAGIKPRHVLAMRDKKAGAPTAANNLVKVLRWMMTFAVDRHFRADNPCIGIKPLKISGDGFHTWTEAEVETFEKHWPIGSRERLAFDLLIYTVQRSWDVRVMGPQHIQAGRLEFAQHKTGVFLSLPIVPALKLSLDAVPTRHLAFVHTEAGAPFTTKGFGNWFSDAARQAGLKGCSAHGLRKTGATRLANAGCSESEIMAWTGHTTPKEVQRYTRARDQRNLADRAVAGSKGEQEMATQSNGLANSADN